MRALVSLLLLLAGTFAFAPAAAWADDAEDSEMTWFAGRTDEVIARIQALPAAELKEFYLRCARASMRGRISTGEIALCSVGYERLLQREFGGNFRAFLEWRRNPHPDREPAGPSPF